MSQISSKSLSSRSAVLCTRPTVLWGVWLAASMAICPCASAQRSRARVASYRVAPNLKNVANAGAMRKIVPISRAQIALLERNGFAAAPTNAQQIFQIYEENDYKNIPSFVSTDAVLQLYHIFYDFALRSVESEKLSPALAKLSTGMLAASVADWNGATNTDLKSAALKNVAFFGVADRLMGRATPLPDAARAMVATELALINAHAGFNQGAIFPYRVDYSQFVARGHYTRTPVLTKYFRAMMWFGLVPFALSTDGKRNDEQIRQGLLWVRALDRSGQTSNWATIYEPTSFFVGAADDLTPMQWKTVSDAVFGLDAPVADFADSDKFERFVTEIEKVASAKIIARFATQLGAPKNAAGFILGPLASGAQLRFMGQRYIPDSEILQRLSIPVQRVFPSGLDVMAVLGSARAVDILDRNANIYNAGKWSGYIPERQKLRGEFAALPTATWNSNLYYGWLYSLKALLDPVPASYPSFMRNAAWGDKSLHSALASWSELRHDTILYGKQSVTECGGGEDEKPFVKGYVEPNVAFYDRLLSLTRASHSGLRKRALLSAELGDKFSEFESLLAMLKRFSTKQLANQPLTRDEYLEIRYIGGKLEFMTLSVMSGKPNSWELVAQADREMAVVADVDTGGGKALQVGVGRANEMWVVVPIEGKLTLARGGIFSFYEFKQPIEDRLTDEKWQAALRGGSGPDAPSWTKSFLVPGKARALKASEFEAYSSGC